MSASLAGSAETWVDQPQDGGPPPELRGYHGSWRGLRRRYLKRREIAEQVAAEARCPERGLPVASSRRAAAFIVGLIRRRPGLAALVVVSNLAAALVGVAVPRLLGGLVDELVAGPADPAGVVSRTTWLVLGVLAVQAFLGFAGRASSTVFSQGILAEARERIVTVVLGLPLSRVEAASTGDLVTRVTRDVGQMTEAVQWALPTVVISSAAIVTIGAASVVNSPLLAIPVVLAFLWLAMAVPGYLRHAPAGYLAEGASYSRINSTLTESIEGARTVEALRLGARRFGRLEQDVEHSAETERYTMSLRNVLFSRMDLAFHLPQVGIVAVAFFAYPAGWVSLGEVTAAVLYAQQLFEPVDRLIQMLNSIQVGIAGTTRLIGIAEVPNDRSPSASEPDGERLVGRDLRFAYREGRDVLHGIDLELVPGERLAIVGPSGSGKSTLSRLLAGINAPRTGEVSVGGVDVMSLPLERLRTEVALVTQEHHVFVGTIRDNIVLAREDAATDREVLAALRAVGAQAWVDGLAEGIDTEVGSGNLHLSPAQAQQIALARLVIADPHTLVLDEATSLIDPRTARHLEGSMHALLTGRTVVAIAHRLHTAHDADRIAVVLDGRIAELGSHDELMRADGEYAALWRAWRS